MRMSTGVLAVSLVAGALLQIPGFIGKEVQPPTINVPAGFTPIFNGKDLTGWHVSTTNHHGITPDYRVMHGLIVGTQRPLGGGGILLTDKKYKNVEVYLEVKPDWGCDSGLFLRSDEAGNAYQVTLDYLPGGTLGGDVRRRAEGREGRERDAEVRRRQALGTGMEARGLEPRPRAHRGGRAARASVDQRPAGARLHRHGESRGRRHRRRPDRDPDSRGARPLGAGRLLALAGDCGEGAAVMNELRCAAGHGHEDHQDHEEHKGRS